MLKSHTPTASFVSALLSVAQITLSCIPDQFNFREESNILVPEDKGEYESQFEGLQYSPSTDTFLAARETAVYKEHGGFVSLYHLPLALHF